MNRDETFKKIKAMYEEYMRLREQVARELVIPEDESWRNPLSSHYVFQDILRETRKALIDLTIQEFQDENPNLKIDTSKLYEHLNNVMQDDFKEQVILSWLKEEYSGKERELSLKNIIENARKLMGHDGLHGKRIKLELWLTLSYSGTVFSYDLEKINAVEKLAKIILENADPRTVEGNEISKRVFLAREDFIFKKHKLFTGPIKSFRLYKNGRLDLEFKTEEDARKVYEVMKGEEIKPLLAQTNKVMI